MIYLNIVSANKTSKLAVVHPNSLTRANICEILSDRADSDLTVIWEGESYDWALSNMAQDVPDLLIVSFSEYEAGLVLFLSTLSKQFPATRVLLIAAAPVSPNACYLLLMTGIDGYMLKDEVPGTLINRVSALLQGFYSFSAFFMRDVAVALEAIAPVDRVQVSDKLSEAERDIFRLMVKGRSNTEIAAFLAITERAVRFHLRTIYRKLGVEGRGQALLKFYNAEIV